MIVIPRTTGTHDHRRLPLRLGQVANGRQQDERHLGRYLPSQVVADPGVGVLRLTRYRIEIARVRVVDIEVTG